jgi:hypothetical protein
VHGVISCTQASLVSESILPSGLTHAARVAQVEETARSPGVIVLVAGIAVAR